MKDRAYIERLERRIERLERLLDAQAHLTVEPSTEAKIAAVWAQGGSVRETLKKEGKL
jgi:hypothetical protein